MIRTTIMEITIDGLSFSYDSSPVLHGISLDLTDKGLVSIIGPNGVGKSTLLRCINRLIEPQEGTILLGGEDVAGMKLKDLAKVVGYVPCATRDNFPLAVIDTVVMGRHPYSRIGSVKDDVKAAHETLVMLDIEDLAFRPFNELSAGQRQKVMLARGIVQKPRILLLDEPTANLDIRHQMEATELLRSLSGSEDILTVMVSHDLNIAAKYSDLMILMHEGSIYAVGTPWEVMTPENLSHVYGVDADVIDHGGRPYMLLNRPLKG